MAQEIQRFEITITAGTAKAAPSTTAMKLGARIVERIDIRIPPGPRGNMGFQLTSGGAQVIPPNPGTYITADDETLSWIVTDQPETGAWQLKGYNIGTFDHTVYVTFFCNPVTDPYASRPANIPNVVGSQVPG